MADVIGALPKELKNQNIDVRVVMPLYSSIDKKIYNLKPLDGALGVPLGVMGELWCEVYEAKLSNSNVPIYFIEYEAFFNRDGIYNDKNGNGFLDNATRFIFFSRASLQLSKKLHFKPNIIHINDWQSAPVASFLNSIYRYDEYFKNTASLLSIHNMQYQGNFDKRVMDILSVGWTHFHPWELEYYDRVNLLKGAIYTSNIITTVSKKYAREIQSSEFGYGLDGVIRDRANDTFGVLNGVDYEEWNPQIDKYLKVNYRANNLYGKIACKEDLQTTFRLEIDKNIPIIGMVTRLVEQKGIDIVKNIIEAGSDFFLMPSRFEPCGLNQMYSLKYGTLPIVRATGGLDDTIENFNEADNSGDGFKFYDLNEEALYNTIGWALHTYYNNRDGMRSLIHNAMNKEFSWEKSAKEYIKLYELAIQRKREE